MQHMRDESGSKKKGMTVRVINNNIESAIMKLKRLMNSEGINNELRKRKQFTPNSVLRRQAMAEARRRWEKKHDQIFEIERPKKKKKERKQVSKAQLNVPEKGE